MGHGERDPATLAGVDQPLLQQIATVTNGSYHSAGALGALAAVTRTIDLRFKIVSEHTEVTGLFAAAGLVLLVVAAALSVLRRPDPAAQLRAEAG